MFEKKTKIVWVNLLYPAFRYFPNLTSDGVDSKLLLDSRLVIATSDSQNTRPRMFIVESKHWILVGTNISQSPDFCVRHTKVCLAAVISQVLLHGKLTRK